DELLIGAGFLAGGREGGMQAVDFVLALLLVHVALGDAEPFRVHHQRRADGDSRRDRDAALDFHAVPLFTGDRVPRKDTATARKKRQGDGQGWYRAVQAHGWHSVGTLRSAAFHRPQPLPRAMPTVRHGLAGAYKREHGGTLKPASRATGRRRPRRSAMFAVLELSDFLIIAVVV